MIKADYTAKLIDVGMARILDPANADAKTQINNDIYRYGQVIITVCTGVEMMPRKLKWKGMEHMAPTAIVALLNRCVTRCSKPTAKDIMLTLMSEVDFLRQGRFTDRKQLIREYTVRTRSVAFQRFQF
jgi:hypothetical protein